MNFLSRAVLFVLLIASSAGAADLSSLTLYRTGRIGGGSGENLVAANVFGDATPEIVSCVDSSAYVLGRSGSDYVPLWHSAPVRCSAVAVADRDGDGAAEIFVATTSPGSGMNGSVLVFDPRTFGPPRAKIDVATATVEGVAVEDVDGDGQKEIVAITPADAYVYDANTLALEWKAVGRGGSALLIGNIDADARPEIVVNSNPAHVLDAQNKLLKWGYAGGFGYSFDLGNVDADPQLEIVFIPYSYSVTVNILNGDTFAASSLTTNAEVGLVAVGDSNGDGQNEILTGNNWWGNVEGYRPSDGTRLWFIANTEYPVTAFATGDFDGDGARELLWRSSGLLFVGDTTGKTIEWRSRPSYGSMLSRIADLDGDGAPEQVLAESDGYYSYVQVLDYRTRAVKGVLRPSPTSLPRRFSEIAIGQLDADAALEIAGAHDDGISVYDGVTFQLQWSAPTNTTPRLMRPMAIANVDSDAVDELIVAQSDRRVLVLNGATPLIQWSSAPLDGSVTDLDVADVNGDGSKDLVVGTSAGYYVFRLPDGLERTHVTRAGVRAVAASDSEFAIIHGNNSWGDPPLTVRTFSGATLAEQWNCSLPTPLYSYTPIAAAYGMVGSRLHLAITETTNLQLYPAGGNSCPAYDTLAYGAQILSLQFLEMTGDGRPELALTTSGLFELRSIGPSSEPRGDFNGDGMITDTDIDALIAYLLAGAAGAPPGGDVNADGHIALDDVFYLINYRHGTGNAPPPQQ